MTIFDRTMNLLEKAMDLRSDRQRIINANIAHEETPGYRAKDLRFQDALSSAAHGQSGFGMRATHVRHVGYQPGGLHVSGRAVDVPAGDLPLDANSVNLDLELVKLSDNAMHYNTAAGMIGIRFRQLLSAIRDVR